AIDFYKEYQNSKNKIQTEQTSQIPVETEITQPEIETTQSETKYGEVTEEELDEIIKNQEFDKLLEYEPKIKNISQNEFDLANEYRVQMISVTKESKANELKELVSNIYPETKYEKTQNNWYRIILMEGKGKSVEDLSIMNNTYNKSINKILKENKKGSCEVETYVKNQYIQNEIDQIKLLADAIKNQTNVNDKYKEKIMVIKCYLEKYLESPMFKGYKDEINRILNEI
ncbi:MAG: hypothetical protein SOT71_11575, partial [Romboutsia timonensis]|uniref:hypothetical protein n=1 Tax=Romboutsia timonensis TaxID=1776391 RepID=UPI002A749C30